MDQQENFEPQSLSEIGLSVWNDVSFAVESLITPGWRQNQFLIVLALLAAAWVMRYLTDPHIETWARSREGWAKWRLRILVQLRRRSTLLFFTAFSWVTYLTMQELTWPSRSYFVGLAATLSTAWLFIAFAVTLVSNPFLRRVLKWFVWIYATLYYLGLLDEFSSFLDSIALTVGSLRISASMVLLGLVLIAALMTAARLVSQMLASMIRRNQDLSPSIQVLAVKAVQVIVYGAAVIFTVQAIGFDLTGLAVLSGAIGVGIGFGLQKVVSNLVSGVIILLDRSIKPGDVISIGDTFGWIETLGGRYASVVTRDGTEYLIPNEDLITGQVVNWSHSNDFVRLDVHFGTSYQDDPHAVRRLAVQAAQGVERVLAPPHAPVCHIVGFGDSSVDYILRFWIRDPTQGLTNIRGNVYLALWDAFQEHGISIPFPQREVRMLTDAPTPGLEPD